MLRADSPQRHAPQQAMRSKVASPTGTKNLMITGQHSPARKRPTKSIDYNGSPWRAHSPESAGDWESPVRRGVIEDSQKQTLGVERADSVLRA
jgi:hypothetical protein